MAEDDVNLVGTLEKIVYTNPENGFLIGTFLTENSTRPITIKGIVFNTRERETLHLKGHWENHKVYGRQFSIREFMPVEPTRFNSHCISSISLKFCCICSSSALSFF